MIRRSAPYPSLVTYDAPSREFCTVRRVRTNTPLQALASLNEPTLLEAARILGQRIMLHASPTVGGQIEYAFRLCLARTPTKQERQRLIHFYEQQWKSFEHDPNSDETLLRVGAASQPASLDARRLAAWMMVANVLLNLDETITKG